MPTEKPPDTVASARAVVSVETVAASRFAGPAGRQAIGNFFRMLTADNAAVISLRWWGALGLRWAFQDYLSGGTEVDTQRTDNVCFEATA
jgi:hypothetical protein